MWNERYKDNEYVYGTEPNTFLAEYSKMLKGPVLREFEPEVNHYESVASIFAHLPKVVREKQNKAL